MIKNNQQVAFDFDGKKVLRFFNLAGLWVLAFLAFGQSIVAGAVMICLLMVEAHVHAIRVKLGA